MSIKRVIENYINGNLKDAKQGAKRYGFRKIREYLQFDLGYSNKDACAIAEYLKGLSTFQECCDTLHPTA